MYLKDCVSAYGSKDGNNYHTTTKDSLAVEINCKSYKNGLYKLAGGNTTRNSNNASTAHDGMNIVRFGGVYEQSEGAIIADVNNCQSINFENTVGSVIGTTTGEKAGYKFDKTTPINRPEPTKQIVVQSNIRKHENEFAIIGTPDTIEIGVSGFRKFDGGVQSSHDYEEVL